MKKVTILLSGILLSGIFFAVPAFAEKAPYIQTEESLVFLDHPEETPYIQTEESLIFLDHPEEEPCEDDRYDDLDLLAKIVVAEAEGESERGKRLVIDTILNRVDSDQFPDTVREVIYQKNQFSSTVNGRLKRVTVSKDIYRLIDEEIKSRVSYECVFFNAVGYTRYGTALFKEGGHYFSSL